MIMSLEPSLKEQEKFGQSLRLFLPHLLHCLLNFQRHNFHRSIKVAKQYTTNHT